jgi:hypothetical protein
MPRGQYDRSKAKAKREALKAAPVAAAPKALSAKTPKADVLEVVKNVIGSASVPSIGPLHSHLNILVQARAGLSGNMQEHNPTVIQTLDAEVVATIHALRAWRETSYGIVEERKSASGKSFVSGVGLPTPPKTIPATTIPAAIPNSTPPLPFSPESVQAAMDKGFGSNPS